MKVTLTLKISQVFPCEIFVAREMATINYNYSYH